MIVKSDLFVSANLVCSLKEKEEQENKSHGRLKIMTFCLMPIQLRTIEIFLNRLSY